MPFTSAHSPDVKDRVLSLAREGVDDASIAATVQIPVETVTSWRHKARIRPPKRYDDVVVIAPVDQVGRRRGGRGGCEAIEVDNRTGRVINQRMPIMGSGRYE